MFVRPLPLVASFAFLSVPQAFALTEQSLECSFEWVELSAARPLKVHCQLVQNSFGVRASVAKFVGTLQAASSALFAAVARDFPEQGSGRVYFAVNSTKSYAPAAYAGTYAGTLVLNGSTNAKVELKHTDLGINLTALGPVNRKVVNISRAKLTLKKL